MVQAHAGTHSPPTVTRHTIPVLVLPTVFKPTRLGQQQSVTVNRLQDAMLTNHTWWHCIRLM
jgi:hypothetical protein